MWKTRVQPLGWEGPLEKKMATHSSTLALKIPWVEEPSRLQSMGSQRVRHYWVTSLSQGLALSSLLVYIFKGLLWMKSEAVCACMTTWNSFFKLFLSKAEFLSIYLPYTHTSLHISASLVAQSVKNPPAKQNTGVGCHFLLHGIFPIQGSNPGLLLCRQTLYHLNHQRSPDSRKVKSWIFPD